MCTEKNGCIFHTGTYQALRPTKSTLTLPFSHLATRSPETPILDSDVAIQSHWLQSPLESPPFSFSTASPVLILVLVSKTSLVIQALCLRVLRQEECLLGDCPAVGQLLAKALGGITYSVLGG